MATDPRITALRRAITATGSQSAMARLLGISQASVWGWLKRETPLPAEYVFKVEARTGISRHDLRPDLYPRVEHPIPSFSSMSPLDVTK